MRIEIQKFESYLWRAAELLRGSMGAAEYKQYIFPLLFWKRISDVWTEEKIHAIEEAGGDYPEYHRIQVPESAHWNRIRNESRDLGATILNSMRLIEANNPDLLTNVFGDAQWTNKNKLPDSVLRDLIDHFSTMNLTIENLPEDELGVGYEFLIRKFADDSGHTAAEYYTNRTVVHLMTELMQPKPGDDIYDPTCGTGGMLISALHHLKEKAMEFRSIGLFGQEINLLTSAIAKMNLYLHGVEDYLIHRGDTLAEPKFIQNGGLRKFNVILANPPYSISEWDRSAWISDKWGRNKFGTPPQGNADYAFFQHILCSLAEDDGRAAILFPNGILFREAEVEFRKKIVNADLIECVIGLGPDLFYNSNMEAVIVVCRTQKPKHKQDKVLLIDASELYVRESTTSFLLKSHITQIKQCYDDFESIDGFAKVVDVEDIEANRFSLRISRYITDFEKERSLRNTPLLLAYQTWFGTLEQLNFRGDDYE